MNASVPVLFSLGRDPWSRHNEVMTPDRTKMSSTGYIRDWNAVVRRVLGSLVMKAVMHYQHELELHSFRHVEPMKVDIHKLPQTQTAIDLLIVGAVIRSFACVFDSQL